LGTEATGTDIGDMLKEIKDPEAKQAFDAMLAEASQTVAAEAANVFASLPPVIQQAQQLMLDPEYQRLSDKEYFSTQTHNPLRTNAVGQVSGIEVYKSSTNTIDTATVSGQSIHHGVMFGPGMVGRATTPDGCFTASPTDDNYGFDVKVMWFALEAEGLLDERFGRVLHSN
jgi:hypothetical protein